MSEYEILRKRHVIVGGAESQALRPAIDVDLDGMKRWCAVDAGEEEAETKG